MPSRIEIEKNPLKRFRKVFDEIKKPVGGLPVMPVKISDVLSNELGDMIARYSAWREFTEDRHSEACAVYAQLKSEYDYMCDVEMLKTKSGSVTERKATAKVSSETHQKGKDLSEAGIYTDLLAGKLESFTNVLAMLSRELSRRDTSY